MPNDQQLGVALSGGGHRATIFGLGALLYVADSGLNRRVGTVTSVSGGSLLNAALALQPKAFNEQTPDEFEAFAARVAKEVAGDARWMNAASRCALGLGVALLIAWGTILSTPAMLLCAAVGLGLGARLVGPKCGGFLFGHWTTWTYLAFLVWGALAAASWLVERVAIEAWAMTHASMLSLGTCASLGWVAWMLGLLGLLLTWFAILQQRHVVAGVAYGHALARTAEGQRADVRLASLQHAGIRHVICATELHAGQHTYFSHDLVYSRGFGVGTTGELPVRTAVQVSANFPGGFPPRILAADRFGFELADPKELKWKSDFVNVRGRRSSVPQWLVLSDGGVFDNMADAWYLEADERHTRLSVEFDKVLAAALDVWVVQEQERTGLSGNAFARRYDMPQYNPDFREPFDEEHQELIDRLAVFEKVPQVLVVINAGKPEPWQSLWTAWIPLIGELSGFVKTTNTMYNNGNRARLRDMDARFATSKSPGAIVDIEEDPLSRAYEAGARRFEGAPVDQAERSTTAVDYYRGDLKYNETTPELDLIERLPAISTAVPTTLSPLGVSTTAHLLYHGYLQAMTTLHVRFDAPLATPRPALADFIRLAQGMPRQSVERRTGV